jgi:hypothetical protein
MLRTKAKRRWTIGYIGAVFYATTLMAILNIPFGWDRVPFLIITGVFLGVAIVAAVFLLLLTCKAIAAWIDRGDEE